MTRGVPFVPSEAPTVRLYSRPGCHLCAVARQMLAALQMTVPFRVEEVNIEGDADLERRFLLEIPVIEVGGEVVTQAPIDLDRVRAAVNEARLGKTPGSERPADLTD